MPFVLGLIKSWKVWAAVLALCAVLAGSAWVYLTGVQNASLKARTALLEGAVSQLEDQLTRERQASAYANSVAQASDARADKALKELRDAVSKDPDASTWAGTRLPAAVADSLR